MDTRIPTCRTILDEKLLFLDKEVKIGMERREQILAAKLEQQEKEKILAFGFGSIGSKKD